MYYVICALIIFHVQWTTTAHKGVIMQQLTRAELFIYLFIYVYLFVAKIRINVHITCDLPTNISGIVSKQLTACIYAYSANTNKTKLQKLVDVHRRFRKHSQDVSWASTSNTYFHAFSILLIKHKQLILFL